MHQGNSYEQVNLILRNGNNYILCANGQDVNLTEGSNHLVDGNDPTVTMRRTFTETFGLPLDLAKCKVETNSYKMREKLVWHFEVMIGDNEYNKLIEADRLLNNQSHHESVQKTISYLVSVTVEELADAISGHRTYLSTEEGMKLAKEYNLYTVKGTRVSNPSDVATYHIGYSIADSYRRLVFQLQLSHGFCRLL